VFHLTTKRWLFFAISGVVIVPGLLALIFWHLNLGIDFTNGSSLDLAFANKPAVISTQGIKDVFTAAGAADVQVLAATSIGNSTPPSQYAYIKFSRPIDQDFSKAVVLLLQDSKSKLPQVDSANVHTTYEVDLPGGKVSYGLMIVPFQSAVKADAIKAALAKLPDTGVAPVGASATPVPTAAATANATAGATPAATTTPAATATPTAPVQTFPVSVADVQLGANANTYTVQSQTFLVGSKLNSVLATLQAKYGYAYVLASTQVGPSIAADTALNSFYAVVAASLAILAYITIAFRKVGGWRQSVKYGTCAIIALVHDALVVLGLWAIFGHLFNFKVDTLFVTAVLTVIGFSVHDTIVVFDRIRENLSRRSTETFDQVVNASLVQTMSRSLNTSLTVLFTLGALTLFGGESIREFTLALLIGIASGTYSSIFNASMLLVVWENGELGRLFGRKDKAQPRAGGYSRDLVRAGAR
jgi:preprotein translocase SecF subunit